MPFHMSLVLIGPVFAGDTFAALPSDAEAEVNVEGEDSRDYFGWSVSLGSDLNCDGESDLVAGALGSEHASTTRIRSASDHGSAYVILSSH